MDERITVETRVHAPIENVWRDFTSTEAIKAWNSASDDWHTTHAENDVRAGGVFLSRMEAKDGSEGFDLTGTYDDVVMHERLAYTLADGRKVETVFAQEGETTHITQTFEPEAENAHELQRAGWQAILNSFKRYCEQSAS
ncbi:MAG TPA: SRPBCC domain-containing protein [Candidatus Paceibacterota bacterium]|jgi:uncharacterized protein YndB with AHSA1/START domain